MRKIIAVAIFVFVVFSMSAVSVEPTPYGARLVFSPPEGTVYTDIYINNGFVVRLGEMEASYEITGLEADGEYLLSIAYRDAENRDLNAEFEHFNTTNWNGEYLWVNNTDNDNNGKVREIRLRAKTVHDDRYGQYNEIYFDIDGKEYRLFPLFDLGSPVTWVEYDDMTPQAICYRTNAELFNKSSIKPRRWRLERMEVSPLSSVTHVDTRAFGFSIACDTSFSFFLDEDGNRHISFLITGPEILRSFFFYSPNGESPDGAFILENLSDK